MNTSSRIWTLSLAMVVSTLAVGCADSPVQPQPAASFEEAPESVAQANDNAVGAHQDLPLPISPRALRRWVRTLRQETARFHSLKTARSAGWDARLTDCMESAAGGMGVHWGNLALFDDVLEERRPEVLLYEPQPSGGKRLVAVEYVVPFAAWTSDAPPELNGVAFHRNEAFGLWILHVWVWKGNPSGTLEDWNPRVTCQWAD